MKAFFKRICWLIIGFILLIQIWIFSSLVWWKYFPVESTMFMRIHYFSSPDSKIHHEWKDSEDISDHFKRAVITAEDGRFLEHNGFDWDGMLVALEKNSEKGNVVAGGSTISQQLAKNLFLYNKRSYIRKAQEGVATWMMEMLWSKHRILEVYVNSVELGDGIYGVEAASRYYFGRSAKNLTKDQAIKLASILPNPKYYQHHMNKGKAKSRQQMIKRYIRHANLPKKEQ